MDKPHRQTEWISESTRGEECPLVSVVMPSLNQGRYIEAAIMSILGPGDQDVELIVADGGSVDGTQDRLVRLAARFGGRLSWRSGPDSGPANAINQALGRARGALIGWLNSDDLYAPEAIAQAVAYFAANPASVMVYGEGEHIDADGKPLGRYPTRVPTAGIASFQSGCFICQPTVFLRRSALAEIGPLDEGLATAFDFDLWLRLFQRFPERIGYIDRVLAHSRLHADCITRKQRRLVATEAVRLLAKYLGHAEDHWLRTHVDELLAVYPFGDVADDLVNAVTGFVGELEDCLEREAALRLWDDLNQDVRLRLALPGLYVDVGPDAWAPQVMEVRVAAVPSAWGVVRLECDHAWPIEAPLALALCSSWGWAAQVRIESRGPFLLDIPVAGVPDGQAVTVRIAADQVFVPNRFPGGGDDERGLAFLVRRVSVL
ncbi:glycosyltransferase family 2 protein [uncultured Thiodictyon sp.]|uniref:glycosyltransferase family 2 protein n=1 Tax=uncultured Thiodictyon sp. TaxID=1846217 RepID=UPI0025E832D5|nr:glycosyltransferase family 2 protein [uncultured Thiodictyon sp.]